MVVQSETSFNKLFQMYSVMAHVLRAVDLTARMRRVTLGGEGLRSLIGGCSPADAIKLYLPESGQPAVPAKFITLPGGKKPYQVRAYTIRRFNPESLELDVDILLHGDSPGSVWARTVQPGEHIGFIGPRHDYRGDPNAVWHLLAGDESALPAIATILESLPAGKRVYAFVEVKDKSDELAIETKADVTLTWLHRGGTPSKESQLLERAISSFALPTGQGYCWVAGNAKVIKNMRRYMLDTWHLSKEEMTAIGYWS